MGRFRVFLPALLLAAFACTGYDEAPSGPSAPDAGLDVDSQVIDGGTDAPTNAGPQTFCTTKRDAAVWCEDFDTLTDLGTLVSESSVDAKPTLSVEDFVSPPRSMRIGMPGREGGAVSTAKQSFVADREVVRLELDWNAKTILPLDGQTVQGFTVQKGSGHGALGRSCVPEDGGTSCQWFIATCIQPEPQSAKDCTSRSIKAPAALKGWSHIALEVTFAAKGHVKFEQDGIVLVDESAATIGMPSTAPPLVSVGFGIVGGNSSHYDVFVDNVFVTMR